jgi:hypothetical protein
MYRWKALDKGYNFALNIILIESLHTKLWASIVAKDPISRISGLPLKSPGTKCHLGAGLVARHRIYYKGWWLPSSSGCGESCESVFAHGSSVH